MFSIYAKENESPWRAGGGEAARVLEALEENPFAPFEEMQFDVDSAWVPYARGRAEIFLGDEEGSMAFRAARPFALTASVSRHPLDNLVKLRAADEYLKRGGALASSVEFVRRLARALPNFSCGSANADLDVHDFYAARDLPFLPECFNFVGWFHLVSPRGYAPYFEPEDLRGLPAHRVEELPDGTFAVTSYPDPFAFEDESVRSRIVEMTNYLNERRKDWQED